MNGVMISEKGKLLVIKNRYKFCFHKYLKQGIERWKCANHSCRAYFKIGKTTLYILYQFNFNILYLLKINSNGQLIFI